MDGTDVGHPLHPSVVHHRLPRDAESVSSGQRHISTPQLVFHRVYRTLRRLRQGIADFPSRRLQSRFCVAAKSVRPDEKLFPVDDGDERPAPAHADRLQPCPSIGKTTFQSRHDPRRQNSFDDAVQGTHSFRGTCATLYVHKSRGMPPKTESRARKRPTRREVVIGLMPAAHRNG